MIITCKQCHTRFRVDGSLIKETGTRVRCSNCQHVFTVFLPPEGDDQDPATIPLPRPKNSAASGNGGQDTTNISPSPPGRQFTAKPIVPAAQTEIYVPPEPNSPSPQTVPDAKPFTLESRTESFVTPPPPKPPFQEPPRPQGYENESQIYSEDLTRQQDVYQSKPPMDDRALGLSGDPTAPQRPEASKEGSDKPLTGEYPPFDPLKTQIPLLVPKDPSREQIIPRKSGPPRKKLFILSAAVIIALCVVGLFFMTHKPSSEGLTAITGENTSSDSDLPRGPLDNQEKIPSTTEKLNFKEDETSHFIRTNLTSGKLLIITGRITNGYHDRRSFIRVRGVLKNPDGVVEAERQSYAGNYLSETELTSLPINEILSRLAIKGGQNGLNVNLEPGQSISFMLVFDKIPEDLVNYEYVVDVVSSTPSGPPTGNAQPQPQSPGSETS